MEKNHADLVVGKKSRKWLKMLKMMAIGIPQHGQQNNAKLGQTRGARGQARRQGPSKYWGEAWPAYPYNRGVEGVRTRLGIVNTGCNPMPLRPQRNRIG